MAVGGVDVLAQPDAGVGDLAAAPGRATPRPGTRGRRGGGGARGRAAARRRARARRAAARRGGGRGCRGRGRPRYRRSPPRALRRTGGRGRAKAERKVAQLDHVAEQDERGRRRRSPRAGIGAPPGRAARPRRWRRRGAGRRRSPSASHLSTPRAAFVLSWSYARERTNADGLAGQPGWVRSSDASLRRRADGARQRDRALLPGDGRPGRGAAAAGDGPGDADDRLGRGVLRAAGRSRLPRRPLRQPRHRPLDQDRGGQGCRASSTCSSAAAAPRPTCCATWPPTPSG